MVGGVPLVLHGDGRDVAAESGVDVLALNDAIADGQDVSWIWDVDWEPLLERLGRPRTASSAGSRACQQTSP